MESAVRLGVLSEADTLSEGYDLFSEQFAVTAEVTANLHELLSEQPVTGTPKLSAVSQSAPDERTVFLKEPLSNEFFFQRAAFASEMRVLFTDSAGELKSNPTDCESF